MSYGCFAKRPVPFHVLAPAKESGRALTARPRESSSARGKQRDEAVLASSQERAPVRTDPQVVFREAARPKAPISKSRKQGMADDAQCDSSLVHCLDVQKWNSPVAELSFHTPKSGFAVLKFQGPNSPGSVSLLAGAPFPKNMAAAIKARPARSAVVVFIAPSQIGKSHFTHQERPTYRAKASREECARTVGGSRKFGKLVLKQHTGGPSREGMQ